VLPEAGGTAVPWCPRRDLSAVRTAGRHGCDDLRRAPADRVGRVLFAVFRAQACYDDALARPEWCRFLRCPAREIPSDASAARSQLSRTAGTCDFTALDTSLDPSSSTHIFCQCTQRPHATVLLRRQRTPAAAAPSNDCAPRTGSLTSFDSRASQLSRHSPPPNSTFIRALHPACHERCSHLTTPHHHDLGQ
jgi:hypothetical protein